MKQLKVWPGAGNKEEFILMINDGEYCITKDLQLHIDNDSDEFDHEEVIDRISIGNAYLTTSRLRDFCNKFHPEVDFDTEFETNKSGVFGRYQDKFGFDYAEWAQEQVYAELVSALNQKGYYLPFDKLTS